MKDDIIDIIHSGTKISRDKISSLVEIPKDSQLGDYSFPCFSFAAEMKKNPAAIAQEIKSKLKLTNQLERIEAVGPYVNFFLNRNFLADKTISEIIKKKDKYGSSNVNKEKTMIEFSQANTHKAFHIGHVRGTSLGESLSRIFEFLGNKPIRANYQGDTGMHVAKWIWCYLTFHKKEKLEANESWIASIYVDAVKRIAERPELQAQVDEINRKLEDKSDKDINSLWKKTRSLSLDALENIYKELDTHFDKYFFESEFEKRGKEISIDLAKKNIAEVSDGATIMRLEDYNLGVWVLLRKDGTVLYSAKDLALAEKKFEDFKIKKAIYIVGAAQRTHFYQLFKTLELAGFKQSKDCEYVPVTEVRLPSGKMSSRTGDNILYSDFMKEMSEFSQGEIKKRYPEISDKESHQRSLAISTSAIKYSMLKQDVNKPIVFDKVEALSFEGDTGPYLLYSYARARSILEKAKYKKTKYTIKSINDSEKLLVSQLQKFPDVVIHAYENLSPNLIANYAYQLAQQFNEFYHSNQVIGSENEQFRLVLVNCFSQVLKNALNLLGIKAIEKM